MWTDHYDNYSVPKDYNRLRQQNQRLRAELKAINDQLTIQVQEKAKPRSKSQMQPIQDTIQLKDGKNTYHKDVLKQEFINAQKQLKIQSRQINYLQSQQDQLSFESFQNLQSQIRGLQEQVNQLQLQNKALLQINHNQGKRLIELSEDSAIQKQIISLREDNRMLKQKLESNSKVRQTSVPQANVYYYSMQTIVIKKEVNAQLKEQESIIVCINIYQMEQQYRIIELEKHLQILLKMKQQTDLKHSKLIKQIDTLTNDNTSLLIQNQQKDEMINKKNYMLPNLSQRTSERLHKRPILDESRCSSKLEVQQKRRVSEVGVKSSNSFRDFVDGVKLHNLKVYFDQCLIKGIQCLYLQNQRIIEGSIHSIDDVSKMSLQYIRINDQDSIADMEVSLTNECITYIQITTNDNVVIKFGTSGSGIAFSKNENEHFGSVYGCFGQGLCQLGFQLL